MNDVAVSTTLTSRQKQAVTGGSPCDDSVTELGTIWHPPQDVLLLRLSQKSRPSYLCRVTVQGNDKQEAADAGARWEEGT